MSATIIPLPGFCEVNSNQEPASGPLKMELRRARIRIAQLETSLTEAMRDNLSNFNRARDAERQLKELRR
ncbi:MAG: hypothetical protein AB8B85_08555 [Paracoccaceae bacterium]